MKQENICRLCLNIVDNEFKIIDGATRKMFDILLISVNLNIIKDSLICKDCTEVMKKCINFKTACLETEERILSFAGGTNEVTFALKDICNGRKDIDTHDEDFICRFCMSCLERCHFIVLDTLMKDVTVVKMLQLLMPKMDMNIIENPVICTSCTYNLNCYVNFAQSCLDIEEKIYKYCQKLGSLDGGQVKLSNILHFLELDNYIQTNDIKQEVGTLEANIAESKCDVYHDELIKAEDIKIEEVDVIETVSETSSGNVKTDVLFHKDNMKMNTYKCTMCTYETHRKTNLKSHMLVHKDKIEVIMYKCLMCNYETKRKRDLKNHMLIHTDITELKMYKCLSCIFQAKRKDSLKRHMLIHKDITEVEMYRCSLCTFKTKHKKSLKSHMLIHKDITELEMYKCSNCTFQTKERNNLKGHMLIHKDISELEMYKCSVCNFQTKHKRGLRSHMLIHKDTTEVRMYKCSMCTYETKHKSNLVRHILIHKDVREVKTYECSMRTFTTKLRSNFVRHANIQGS